MHILHKLECAFIASARAPFLYLSCTHSPGHKLSPGMLSEDEPLLKLLRMNIDSLIAPLCRLSNFIAEHCMDDVPDLVAAEVLEQMLEVGVWGGCDRRMGGRRGSLNVVTRFCWDGLDYFA